MNTLLLLGGIGFVLYIGANIRLWRKLNRDEERNVNGQQPRPRR